MSAVPDIGPGPWYHYPVYCPETLCFLVWEYSEPHTRCFFNCKGPAAAVTLMSATIPATHWVLGVPPSLFRTVSSGKVRL